MKPVIGVTPLYDDKLQSIWMLPAYLELIEAAGGLPIVLPLEKDDADIPQLLRLCDGILLTGGHDVNPKYYGEDKFPACGEPNNNRDAMELEILAECMELDMPTLAICRGLQLMNVALGGTLYQDLSSQRRGCLDHKMNPPYYLEQHAINIDPKQPLGRLLREESMGVNSYHHQAIKELADELIPMATATDGIVEAAYLPKKRFMWGVQWHPEYSFERDPRQLKIARKLIDACRF